MRGEMLVLRSEAILLAEAEAEARRGRYNFSRGWLIFTSEDR